MKIVFMECLLEGFPGVPVDVGALICDSRDYEVLAYMGQTIMEEEWDLDLSDSYPVVAQVNSLIKPVSVDEADKEVSNFILDYILDPAEGYLLICRGLGDENLFDWFPRTCRFADEIIDPWAVEDVFSMFSVDSEYHHEWDKYAEVGHRAVRLCAYNHAELIVYRNNLIEWGYNERLLQ